MRAIIDKEIQTAFTGDPSRAGSHGVDLSRCLLARPESRTFLDSFDGNRPVRMWLVLEEDPDNHAGYQIVFDGSRSAFGLAVPGTESAVFIGYYGSFVDTLEAM
ncbi:MAG: hypothetical protein R3F30_13200 [Planctomycetota bacterium]